MLEMINENVYYCCFDLKICSVETSNFQLLFINFTLKYLNIYNNLLK